MEGFARQLKQSHAYGADGNVTQTTFGIVG
jgi:hypothetical protein